MEKETTNKKPDNVSDNPGILPYGSNVGAPAIKLENLQTWKDTRVQSVNKQLEGRLLELKKEYALNAEKFLKSLNSKQLELFNNLRKKKRKNLLHYIYLKLLIYLSSLFGKKD